MISFVGAGPGAADLITLRGANLLAEADVVIWAASLVPEVLLQRCRPDVVAHDSKTMTLEEVCSVFAKHREARIVRLHSGDPTVYSAIAEQITWCRTNGHEYEVVPGVSSVAALAAAAGTELTVPGIAQTVVHTRLARRTAASMPEGEVIEAHATVGATLAVYLSATLVDELQERLVGDGSAYQLDTPVVIGHRVSWPDERVLRTSLGELAASVRAEGLTTTTLFLIGPALAGSDPAHCSHVYDAAFSTQFREATA